MKTRFVTLHDRENTFISLHTFVCSVFTSLANLQDPQAKGELYSPSDLSDTNNLPSTLYSIQTTSSLALECNHLTIFNEDISLFQYIHFYFQLMLT